MDFWDDEAVSSRIAYKRQVEANRELTPEEIRIVALKEREEWEAFRLRLSQRAALAKAKLFDSALAGTHTADRLIGELQTLEWVISLPTQLAARQRRHSDEEVAQRGD